MTNHCDICAPSMTIASRKLLCLKDDPSTTIWVCDLHARIYCTQEGYIIGDADVIEELWEREEFSRELDFRAEGE